ncbi:RNA-directed DNA polymerase, eukaryota [Tanacetum coccineum]
MGGVDDWQEVSRKKRNYRSKEDDVAKISTSIYVTNFPNYYSAKDLFQTCKQYGHVTDSFIPNKRSKEGKRFGFVRFINVFSVERLVDNLCTIWVNRLKLHANLARFTRAPLNSKKVHVKANVVPSRDATKHVRTDNGGIHVSASYANVAKAQVSGELADSKPALVLDDSCANNADFSLSLNCKLKEFSSLPNLNKILNEEGFTDIIIRYLGGFWVLLQFPSKPSLDNFKQHVGANSWFSTTQQASNSFVVDERVAWLDIEGVPLCAWSQNTFNRIASTWGSLLYDEDIKSHHFHRKRLCIKTTFQGTIPDSLKIIYKGKLFLIRVKELSGWAPSFTEESDSVEDDESVNSQYASPLKEENIENHSDDEEVPETVFDIPAHDENNSSQKVRSDNVKSADPFQIYDLLKKKKPAKTLKSVRCFTPCDNCCSGQFRDVQAPRSGGSILQMVEDFIKVGQAMGYKMDGCGILCVWDSSMFQMVNYTISDNFIAIMGNWLPTNKKLLVITIYAPQELADKKKLWDYLNLLIGRWTGDALVMGDFNEVLEVPLCGYSFTWSLKDASKMSRLDRFLVSEDMLRSCHSLSSLTLDRYHSDHRPILLRELNFDYGPTPFRFYHNWFDIPGFDVFVTNTWRNIVITEHNAMFRMAKKLKILKGLIRVWVKENKSSTAILKNDLKTKLSVIDSSIDNGNVSPEVLEERLEILNKIYSLTNTESCELAQKAKVQWAVEGDENTKFFHGIINKRRNNLAIRGITAEGMWSDDPNIVKKEFFSHFQNRFEAPRSSRLHLDMQFPNKLSRDQSADLERIFSKEEIKQAVWDCGLDKSPGPDGFTFGFYRRFWNLIECDVEEAVIHFYKNGFCHKGGNSSFIALIPKKQGANMVNDFRPISLIGSLYKIITKLLANRLAFVINELVSDCQSAFISKRHILDGPFILNEVIHWCKAKKKNSMIFKVDFEKAFDSVRWDFLEDVMKNFGFGPRWCDWIMSCLKSSKGSVLVNGSPTPEFHFYKGLKQGDPLSPFLFILVMETLHLSFENVVKAGLFKRVLLDDSMQLTHLFYADDVIFLGQWCTSNISVLMLVLDCFFRASGLRINIHKSQLMGVAVERSLVNSAAFHIGCSSFSAPFSYLGVNVGGNMSRIASWDGILSKVLKRLSKWKMKVLSAGGRLTLLKSVLGATPLYYMSLYIAPKQVIKKLESIRSHFFNGAEPTVRKISLFKWENVLAAKEMGGLGVSSFFALNRALIFKWVWRFRTQGNSTWVRVIKALHGEAGNLGCLTKANFPSNWSNIIRSLSNLHNKGIDLLGVIKKKVGNGESTRFWEDPWRGEVIFKDLYPRLYALETIKSISVANKMAQPLLSSSFRRTARGGTEQHQMGLLQKFLEGLILPNVSDRWVCSLTGDGEFSVSSVRNLIDEKTLGLVGTKTRWSKFVPIKVNILSWKVKHDNLATRLNLSRRGLDLPSIFCPMCNIAVESSDHLFFKCSLTKDLYTFIARWWDVSIPEFFSYDDWWEWICNLRLNSTLKLFLESVFYTSWWLIWDFRNKSIFGSSLPLKARLCDDVVGFSFIWCNSRCKLNFSRLSWLKNPTLISL